MIFNFSITLITDSRTSVSGTSTIYPEPSSSQQKVSAQKAKRQSTDVKIKHMNAEKIGHCSSFKEMDPTMVTIVHNEANELTVIVAADESMPTNELNSCLTAEAVQYESSDTKDSNVCISKSENVGPAKRQRKSKCGGDAKAVQNVSVENKPKRSRATRSKANSINIEQPPLASQTNYDATGKCNTSNTIYKPNKNNLIFSFFSLQTHRQNTTSKMNGMQPTQMCTLHQIQYIQMK